MANPHVLLLGGHGKIALLLTPLLLARNWDVTSVIRNPAHEQDILDAGALSSNKGVGKLDVLVSSLDDVKSDADAKAILDRVKPDYVVWAAGAGGKGAPTRTYAIDQDAAKHFISTAFSTPSITKFLLISHLGSRNDRGPWMSDDLWERTYNVNTNVIPHYYHAKLEADEFFTAMAKKRAEAGDTAFQAILLRPGPLADEPATRKVSLGKTGPDAKASVPREDVAIVADLLLARDDSRGWVDLLGGEEPVDQAVETVVRDKVDAIDGENVARMIERFQ